MVLLSKFCDFAVRTSTEKAEVHRRKLDVAGVTTVGVTR